MKTYNDIYLGIKKALRQGGIEDSDFEARLLLGAASKKTKEELLRDFQLYTTDEIEKKAEDFVWRRLSGEPIAYITESWEFYGIPFYINSDVLIPRIDTEIIVDTAISILNGYKMDARILDLCCGSGCITCALAKQLPAAKFLDIDISQKALEVARRNIADLNLNTRVVCMQSDALSSPPMGIGTFDMIVSNPPYIPTEEINNLSPSVSDFEPLIALDGGSDGLKYYKAIIKYWKSQIKDNGFLLFEVGENEAEAVSGMMMSAGFSRTSTAKDTINVDRVVIGQL